MFPIIRQLALLCALACAPGMAFADSTSDDALKKVEEAMNNLEAPANVPKSREEAMALMNPPIQAMVDQGAAIEKLKTQPLDLKFTALDGAEVDLAKMRGKVVLIDFWSSGCGMCVDDVPNLVQAYKKLNPKGFEIIGISIDRDKSSLEAFIKENGMAWPQFFDGKGWENEIASRFGILFIPAMWLVDKKGMLVETRAREDLEGKVEKLLAE
jgi:thiol-disulfide isomerase/thioredoxin